MAEEFACKSEDSRIDEIAALEIEMLFLGINGPLNSPPGFSDIFNIFCANL